MASPFRLFRKYQKAFIAIAAVVAMFIFVLADPLMSWLQSGSGGPQSANTVVAEWEGGSLTLRQLDQLTQRRFRIHEFLSNLIGLAAGMVEEEGGTPIPPTLPDFRLQDTNSRAVQIGVITTRVLAEQAEDSGIAISDQVINHYLREWGLRKMGDVEMATLLSRVGLTDKMLFAGLRELLMGNFYINSYGMATRGVMPEQRWQDWKRINERIALATAILPAEKFLDQVEDPSETELQQFYDLHKERVADLPDLVMNTQLASPNPGFREPRRVKLQYLVGNVSDWTLKMMDSVTEDEIKDYYERNKRGQFVSEKKSISAEGLFDDGPTDEPTDEQPEAPASDQESMEETPEASVEEAAESESMEAEPTDEAPAEPAESADAGAEAPAEESEPAEETQPAEESEPADDESGRNERRNPFRLAAFQDVVVEAEDSEAEDSEAETAESDEVNAPDAPAADDDASEGGADDEDLTFVPLEEVRGQIQRTLARDKAVLELQKVVDRTYADLKSRYNPYGFKVVSARSEGTDIPAPPAELSNYKAIAAETGLASEETVLLSQMELAETFVGRARDAQSGRELVLQAMFGDNELFEPFRAIDLDGNSYIVCKTEDVDSRIPELDEVRDTVVAAWKQQQAAELALAKAEELAKQASDSGNSVEKVAADAGYETVTTDLFSWLSFGMTPTEMQRGPRLGDAPPLEAVGPEFMTKAFELGANEKAAVLNYSHSAAYLFEVSSREKTEEELRQQFLAEANSWYGGQVMSYARWGNTQRELLAELSEEVGLNLDKLEELMSSSQDQ